MKRPAIIILGVMIIIMGILLQALPELIGGVLAGLLAIIVVGYN